MIGGKSKVILFHESEKLYHDVLRTFQFLAESV